MSNERLTENIVREHFKEDPLFKSIKFEEQRSSNKRIYELFKGMSKGNGHGYGFPEFIITFPSDSRFIIVIECKANRSKHESKSKNNPKDYAVDGVLHYANALRNNYDVLAIAVSGEVEPELEVSSFLFQKGFEQYDELKDKKLLSINGYLHLFKNEQFAENLRNIDIISKAIELNNEYNDYSIPEQTRNTMVSAILLSLLHEPFRNSYESEPSTVSLGESMMHAVNTILAASQVRNRNAMIGEFSKLLNEPLFREKEIKNKREKKQKDALEVLKEMVKYLHLNVYPLIKMEHSGYDVLGRFYTEFIRYAGSEQKQGLVLTPSHITDLFCDLANINVNDVIYDPCCGTAGFLIAAMKRLFKLAGNDEKKKSRIRQTQLVGVELRPSMYTYACSNMMMRGDGKSNVYCGDCYQTAGAITVHRPTVAFLNPPYDVGAAGQLRFIAHALEMVAPQNGRVVAIVQMSCAIKDEMDLKAVKRQLLERHHLKAVLSMPDDLFYPVGVVTCVMVWEANKPNNGLKTWFGYFKDDGFEKRKHQGRIDARGNFKAIRERWLNAYNNADEIDGLSVKHEISEKEEWCAEAYLKTDYGVLTDNDFICKLRNYSAFLMQTDNPSCKKIYNNIPLINKHYFIQPSKWKWFKYDKIFDIKKGFYNKKPDSNTCGDIPFIGATDSNNGVTSMHSLEIIEKTSKTGDEPNAAIDEKIFQPNCITVSNNGSIGYAFYQAKSFTCTHDVNPLYLKNKKLSPYIAMFLCTLIELERYRWAYGRKWRPVRMPKSTIKLPVTANGVPDWQFMEDYIKGLPYSANI
jgi:type I restriction enzyme M protein